MAPDGNLAVRHLKVHRNTLVARVHRVEELLGLDLTRVADQATLTLALRIMSTPHPAPAQDVEPRPNALDLDAVLRLPAAQQWAATQLRPLHRDSHASALEPTLRAWLVNDRRLSATARSPGISVAARVSACFGSSTSYVARSCRSLMPGTTSGWPRASRASTGTAVAGAPVHR